MMANSFSPFFFDVRIIILYRLKENTHCTKKRQTAYIGISLFVNNINLLVQLRARHTNRTYRTPTMPYCFFFFVLMTCHARFTPNLHFKIYKQKNTYCLNEFLSYGGG